MINIISYLPTLLFGTVTTLEVMACSLLFGLLLAVLFTLLSRSHYAFIKTPVDILVFFIRGTPLLVQIFLIYYGSGQFTWLRESSLWIILKEPFACAVIAFSLNTSAYTKVLLSGAIDSIPHGEIEACHALGMNKWHMLKNIILPRAFRIALPAYSNEVIMILKGTALASTITLMDLMGTTQRLIAQTYETIPLLILAGIIYLLLNGLLVGVFKFLEHKANIYLRA